MKVDNVGHVHASSMALYAQDAVNNKHPWLLWERTNCTDRHKFMACTQQPSWCPSCIYRRKLKCININGWDVPVPERVAPTRGTIYYYPSLVNDAGYIREQWDDSSFQVMLLERGFVHLHHDNVNIHREALISFTENKG